MEFGKYIKEIRTNKSLTLRETAKRTKVSHPYLSQLETGENKKPTPEIIKKLAEGLNVNYYDLLVSAGYIDQIETDLAKAEYILNEDISQKEEQSLEKINQFSKNLIKNPSIEWAKKIAEEVATIEKLRSVKGVISDIVSDHVQPFDKID